MNFELKPGFGLAFADCYLLNALSAPPCSDPLYGTDKIYALCARETTDEKRTNQPRFKVRFIFGDRPKRYSPRNDLNGRQKGLSVISAQE